jgi:integrase
MANIQTRQTDDGKTRYRAQVRLKGHPHASATFERLTDAKHWAQQTEAAIREGRHFKTSESKRHTLADMVDRYIRDVLPNKPRSERDQRRQLLWWREQIGSYSLADVTPALIAEQRDNLLNGSTKQGGKRQPATVNRYLAALSHCFTIAVREWGWLEHNPLSKVSRRREPRGRVRYLLDDELERLLEACRESRNPHLYDIVVLALSTGMRRGEIMNLEWQHVSFERSQVVLEDTKNGERRVVPLVGIAHEALLRRSRLQRIDSPYVFPAPYRHGVPPRPASIQSAWKTALERAHVTDFRFHDLRHSAASHLAMNGATLAEIAEVLGHKTLSMVKRYAHFSEAHTSKVVERMVRRVFDGVT